MEGFSSPQFVPRMSRQRIPWYPGERIADTSRMFGPYIDLLNDLDFSLARDPLAHDRMWRDCQIRSALRMRMLATGARKPEFIPRNADCPICVVVAKRVSQWWTHVRRPTETLLNMLEAIPRGSSFNEIVWEQEPKSLDWIARDILPVNKDRFAFSLDGKLCLINPNQPFFGDTVPSRVFIHHRYDPEPGSYNDTNTEARLYFGWGEFDRIYPWFLWKMQVLRKGFQYLDRWAMPQRVGRYPQSHTQMLGQINELLKRLNSYTGASWPGDEGWGVDIIQADTTAHNVSLDWINYIDNQIMKMILGSTLMQEAGDRGSYSLGAVHTNSVFGTLSEYDSQSLCDTLENTYAKWICEMNGIPPEHSPRCVQTQGKSADMSTAVDTMLTLAERTNFPVSVEQIAEASGVRQARPDETILTPNMAIGGTGNVGGGGSGLQDILPAGKTGRSDGGDFPTAPKGGHEPVVSWTGWQTRESLDLDLVPEKPYGRRAIEALEKNAAASPETVESQSPGVRVTEDSIGPVRSAAIERAGRLRRTIEFDYVALDGNNKHYQVEPYSYKIRRDHLYLYGFDVADDTIKSFFARKLRNVNVTRQAFRPKWAIRVAAADRMAAR